MKPLPFEKVKPCTPLELILEDGTTCKGMFTELRIDRSTIPHGKYACDIRHGDDGDWCDYTQAKSQILVNHAGTIITDVPIPNADRGVYIDHWRFLN